MKILYISHQKEESGYGRYCREFLKALKTTKHEISSFALTLGKTGDYKDETEKVSLYNPDVCIQNILPHFMSKGSFKCVGGAILESKDVVNNPWYQYLEIMDEIWYPHYPLKIFKEEREVLSPIDTNKFNKKYLPLNIPNLNETYKFYWIGEISKRKNLMDLIKSYYQTFSVNDPVSLIIKCHKENFNAQDCKQEMETLVQTVQHGMKLYDDPGYYPKLVVFTDYWTEEQVCSLHQYADCFVSSSFGESINFPMLDALLANNPVVSTATFATESYSKYGFMKISFSDDTEQCFGQVNTFPWYQSSRESWPMFNEKDFGRQMLSVYSERPKINNDLSGLSYENIGKRIEELL